MATPLEVVCALIFANGQLLAAQRGPGRADAGFWEFPGGKVETGESLEEALHREIQEELGLCLDIQRPLPPLHKQRRGQDLRLWPFVCQIRSGEPIPREHSALHWGPPAALHSLNWLPGDRLILEQWCVSHPDTPDGDGQAPLGATDSRAD
ncbi:MAG: (deoxy)nucleoside triphosphate pyrophosphohydrolase [Candidatus Sericytochromatia bacterium]